MTVMGDRDDSTRVMSRLFLFYGSTALWNFCLAMFQVLVPIYAFSLGFSALKIGGLLSLPVLLQIVMRFAGGVLSDRFGEHRVLQVCYLTMALSAAVMVGASGFTTLLLAQAIANISRSTFWVPAQSLVTQLPGSSRETRLARLLVTNYSGATLGYNVAGFSAALLGYRTSFIILTGAATLCTLAGLALPRTEPKPSGRSLWQISGGILRFLSYRPTWLVFFASFSSAVPISLMQSIYPIYLAALAHREEWIGMAVSLRPLGAVIIGLMAAPLITGARQRLIYALALSGVGLFLVASGLTTRLLPLSLCIALLGAAGGILEIWYQARAADLSQGTDRSVAIATMGQGWNLSHLVMPVLMGWLVEIQSFRFAFSSVGIFFLLMASGTNLWYHLLTPTVAASPDWKSSAPAGARGEERNRR